MQGAGKLELKIIEAKLTHDTDIITRMDPYVVIKYNSKEVKTAVKDGAGKHPVWNETFHFDVHSLDDHIQLKVMDKDTFTADDMIGSVDLTVSRLLNTPGIKTLYQI